MKERSSSAPEPDSNTEKNELFSIACFKVITDLTAYLPMWSACFADPVVHSNAVVESHFRTLKHGTLNKKRNLRSGEIARQEVLYLKAKVNKAVLKRDPAQAKNNTSKPSRIQR